MITNFAMTFAAVTLRIYLGLFAASGIVSGHTLKHLCAAMAPACLLYALRRRRYHAARQPYYET